MKEKEKLIIDRKTPRYRSVARQNRKRDEPVEKRADKHSFGLRD